MRQRLGQQISRNRLPYPAFSLIKGQKELHPTVNFARNTPGGSWDDDGLFRQKAIDEPRFNYNSATGIYEGLTIMDSWTNEIKDPRDMTTGNWSGSFDGKAIASRDLKGINGNTNEACTITDDSTTNRLGLQASSVTVSNDSSSHTGTFYVKKDNDESRYPHFQLLLTGGTLLQYSAIVNTKTGEVNIDGDASASDVEIIDKGSKWKVIITITNNSTGNTSLKSRFFPAWNSDFTASGNNNTTGSIGLELVEVFLNRTSPSPTSVYGDIVGQPFAQDADIVRITDLNSIYFNPNEGTFLVECISPSSNITAQIFDISDNGTNNRIQGAFLSSGTFFFKCSLNGITIGKFDTTVYETNKVYRITIGVGNNFKVSINNNLIGSASNSQAMDNITKIDIGRNQNGLNYLNSFMNEFKYHPRELN